MSLFFGIAIPLLTILVVIAAIRLPSIIIRPHYDLIYVRGLYYYGQRDFIIKNGRLARQEERRQQEQEWQDAPSIYIYDTKTHESRPLSFEDASKLDIDSNNISPDGFAVTNGNKLKIEFPLVLTTETDFVTYYLKGRAGVNEKLNLEANQDAYNDKIFIFGWVR